LRALWECCLGILQTEGKFAEWVFGKIALVDVGGDFAPTVERLHGEIAALDFGEFDERAAFFVYRHPSLAVCDVKVGVRPIHATGLAVNDLVPFEPFLEIKVFLPQYQQAAEHVFVSLDNVPVGDGAGGLRVNPAGRNARYNQRTKCKPSPHAILPAFRLSRGSSFWAKPCEVYFTTCASGTFHLPFRISSRGR